MYQDQDGQPAPGFRAHDNLKKHLEHLLGLCRGLIADNHLSPEEVVFLDTWLKEHPDLDDTWPGQTLKKRLTAILADDRVDPEEADDLHQTINQIIGGDLESGVVAGGSALPLSAETHVTIPEHTFCLTGKFLMGARKSCERAIADAGGQPAPRVTQKLDYLVIGSLASRDWAHTSHGRKIEAAIANQQGGATTRIIDEETLAAALP